MKNELERLRGQVEDLEAEVIRLQRELKASQLKSVAPQDADTQLVSEKVLHDSDERYQSLFENMLNGFAYCRMLFEDGLPKDFIYLKVNNTFETLTGLKNVEGKKVSEVLPGIQESDPEVIETYSRVALTGKPERFEMYVKALSDWFAISVYSPRKEYFVAVFDVITERKQIENAQLFLLQCGWSTSGEDFFESLARYLAETLVMDYVCIDRLEGDGLSAKTVAIYFDGKFEDNLAYALKDTPCGDVVGKTICSFPKDVRRLFPRDVALQEMMAESYVGTTLWGSRGQPIGLIAVIGRQRRADLHLAEAILKVVAIRAAGELERRQTEAETKRLASFPMLNPRPIVEVDVAGHVHFCNPTAMQMFPDLCQRGPGHPWLADWKALLRNLREAGSESIVREVLVGEKWHHQTMHLVEDAQRVRIYGADITARKQAEEALLKTNAGLEQKVSDRTSELAAKIDELRLANEGLESRTKQLGLLATELTLTEQRERKRLSQILHDGLQQHLLSAKMRLGGVAELILDVDLKQAIDEIETIISESVQLSRSLSAALSPPILHECGLSGGLEWLVRWMRDKHNFKVDLSIETQPELPEDVKILVFESVRELLVNAVKHSKVRSARVSLNQENGDGLRIVVSDEGTGFDPYQLKPPGEEGGFGLFSVCERIGLIGGSIEIESAPGKGSRLVLLVPHGQASAVPFSTDRICTLAAEPREDTVKDQGTTIRVLLADDHALFRNALGRLLKNVPGLEVVGHANDGKEAIELAQKLKPNVILMDISMPRVNGIEATRIIHREYPDICIIGLSMYEDQERAQAMRDAGAADYKNKGCEATELVEAVRACVQGGSCHTFSG